MRCAHCKSLIHIPKLFETAVDTGRAIEVFATFVRNDDENRSLEYPLAISTADLADHHPHKDSPAPAPESLPEFKLPEAIVGPVPKKIETSSKSADEISAQHPARN